MAKIFTSYGYFMTLVHPRRWLPGCKSKLKKKTDFARFQASASMAGFHSSRKSSSVDWSLFTDFSGRFIGPIFESQAAFDLLGVDH